MASLMGNNAKTWLYKCSSFVLVLTFLLVDVFVFLERGFSIAPEAEAATGEFSVFRETIGTEVITGTGNNVTWDTAVSASANIALQGNTSDIDLADGGKYLVLYNAWTEEGATGGGNRRSVASYLTLNGNPLEYGWGGGYIRDSENDFTAYNSGAAIISATAGDDLAVVLDRDDGNAGGGTAIRPGTNGVSVVKLADDLDYLRVHASARSADISGNTTFTAVNWDTADEVDTGSFAFSAPGSGVTVSGAASQKFLVTTNVKLNVDGANGPRQNYELRLTLDGVEVSGTRSSAYIRFDNDTLNGTLQYTGVIQKTSASDQTLVVEVRREGVQSATTDIVGDQSALAIVALPETAEVLSLATDADQGLTSAPSVFTFGTQLSTAPSFLSHSTISSTEDITINTDGDYLVFATTYTSRTSGGGRDIPRIDWLLDSATQPYGGHGHYNRGDQGSDDTFTSGGSGGAIFSGLTSGQLLELVQSDESSGTPVADFLADRVAVQVLEISELIPETPTNVFVAGTQPTTLTPDTSNIELGEQYAIVESDTARNVTSLTISENGTVAADTGLANIRLYYDLDTSAPYDCSSESYGGAEDQYGATSTFSGVDGTVSFTGSETINPTQAMCVYVVFDTTTSTADGETVNIFMDSPAVDVVVTGGSPVSPSGSLGTSLSTIVDAEITQANYHWRNDDGSETGATSATGGVENTPGLAFAASTPQRLRLGINAQGSGSQATAFKLEYGENVTTCGEVSSWVDVGAAGGAWDMADSVNVFEGGNTTNISVATGGVSDGVGAFVTPNGGVRDVSSQTGTIAITAVDFVELEYSVQATLAAIEGVAYCFRVVNAANAAAFLTGYDERVPFTVPASAVSATLTDFPVYVDLSNLGADFWTGVQADGDDIRITTSDAVSEAPFELVSINTGANTGELHFKAPTLSATTDTQFFIYFGDAAATPYSATDAFGRNNVWTNGFEAVYHLEESGAGTLDEFVDSTGNNYDAQGGGGTPASTPGTGTGQLGTGQVFDGVDDFIDLNTAIIPSLTGANSKTLSIWARPDSYSNSGGLWNLGGSSASEDFSLRVNGAPNEWRAQHWAGADHDYAYGSTGVWQHAVLSYDGTTSRASMDGVERSNQAATLNTQDSSSYGILIGRWRTTDEFDGQLDEFRVANVARSADWIATEYANQSSANTFYSVSAAETPTSALGSVSYSEYPEATLSADVSVSSIGSQINTVTSGSTDTEIGGAFVITSNSGAQTVTAVTITETGSIDAQQFLSNPRVAIDFDTSAPYDCVSESYGGGDTTLTGSAFIEANGSTTVSGSVSITVTQALCVYVLVDVDGNAPDGSVIDFEISLPNVDVVAGAATVGPGSAVVLSDSTIVQAPSLTQANYHWRNDNGTEADATSATGGIENTTITGIFQNTQQRLRFAVSNDGSATASGAALRLEYGTKVTSCENVGSWQRVGGGVAFTLDTTSQLVDGNNTTNIAEGTGGVSNPNTTFLSPNSAQLETADELAVTSLTNAQYIELEYALTLTDVSAFSATYCFRLTDAGTTLATYTNYPELTVQDRQDFLVQRGTEVLTGTSLTLTAGVDYTAPSANTSAYVRITDTNMTGAGSITLGQARQPDDLFAYIEGGDNLTSSFSIVRPPTATDDTRVQWEIVEYIGVPNADNEFIVRDAGEVTYGGSALFATGTAATGVTDDSDVVVFITGQFNPATNVNDYNTGLSISSWDAVRDRPVFERGDADGIATRVSYAVVEFVGASWSVQRAEHTFTASGVTETESITAVNSLLRTFVHSQKLSGDELYNLDESGHEVWLSSIGAVSFQLENGSTNPDQQKSVAWVIESTQIGNGSMGVYRSNGLIAQTNTQPNSYLFSIGATVEPSNASMWATTRSTGGGSAHPRAQLGARVLDETQFELWKSDEGQNQNFRVAVVEWPVAETSIRQTHYRFYVDNDTLTPTDPWPVGASDLGENTAMTDIDEPLGEGEQTRIRVGLFINNASLVADSVSFKLQQARRVTTCSAISVWNDVGDAGSGDAWRAVDGTPVDSTELAGGASLLLSVSDIAGTYEENSPSAPNPNSIAIGEYVEYDWIVQNNAATQKSSYCFRMTESDGAVLDGYDVYPTVRTSGYTPVIANWRWYNDEGSLTPTTALAGENVAPSAVSNGEELKLRVSVTEVEGAPGSNVKFNLQYSEYPDFRDAVVLNATTSCDGNDLWCYVDGAGADNQTIDTALLSGVDSCVGGVGTGCGTRNEAQGLSGPYDQPAFSTSEHEFTLRHDGARVNVVYYFRLFDATNDVPLFTNTSFPSLTTQGAVLTFTISGIDNNQTTEGVTTDATTTATRIDFGSLTLDTDTEAAQRLTVFANGTQGYQVFMDISQDLINSYGDSIPSLAGTNAAPATWESQCTSATTGCFGYHAGDNSLYGESVRFAVDNSYAGIESGLVEIMSSNIPVTFDVSDIVYRTRVGFLQPAGDYTTTVRYIIVPIF